VKWLRPAVEGQVWASPAKRRFARFAAHTGKCAGVPLIARPKQVFGRR